MIAILAPVVSFGCGKKQGREPSWPSAGAKGAPTARVDPLTTGSIAGTVFLVGPPPVVRPINMSSEAACVKRSSPQGLPQTVVAGNDGTLANVVVYVRGGLGAYRFEAPKEPVVLDQKDCMYQPHVVALRTNQRLEIRNDDATVHNVHALAKENNEWNKAQPAGSAAIETSFGRPELAIPFMCNVHPWMRAFVFVFDHPYYSVTAREGKFELGNLPPGTYTIEAWQEKFGTQRQMVTIRPRDSKEVSFRFRSGQTGD